MKILTLLLLLSIAAFTLVAAESIQQSVFEIRLVKDGAEPDTEQMTVTRSSSDDTQTQKEALHVQKTPLLDRTAIDQASVTKDVTGRPQILITFTEKGGKLFADVTRRNVGNRLAIVIDGQLLSAPKVMDEITGGKAMISGAFSEEEANKLVRKVNAAVKG